MEEEVDDDTDDDEMMMTALKINRTHGGLLLAQDKLSRPNGLHFSNTV